MSVAAAIAAMAASQFEKSRNEGTPSVSSNALKNRESESIRIHHPRVLDGRIIMLQSQRRIF